MYANSLRIILVALALSLLGHLILFFGIPFLSFNSAPEIADDLIICTDDGSYGRKSLVTEPLKELCERNPKPDLAVAIGPPVMMKFCAATTKPYAVPTVVSLNTIMVDGTGMCGGCRVDVGGETKFACVDGPEFDGHLVDFNLLADRLGTYREQEQEALAQPAHACRAGLNQ